MGFWSWGWPLNLSVFHQQAKPAVAAPALPPAERQGPARAILYFKQLFFNAFNDSIESIFKPRSFQTGPTRASLDCADLPINFSQPERKLRFKKPPQDFIFQADGWK